MALVKVGATLSEISGTIGGVVFARNKGGLTARNKSSVVNPNTELQQANRTRFASLTSYWSSLDQAERNSWNLAASDLPITNRLGEARYLSGAQLFQRQNLPRLIVGQAVLETAVYQFMGAMPFGGFATATVDVTGDSTELTLGLADGILNAWRSLPDSRMLVYVSPGQVNAGVTFYKGAYRFLGYLPGNATTTPTQFTDGLPYVVPVGQKVAVKAYVINPTYDLSATIELLLTAVEL